MLLLGYHFISFWCCSLNLRRPLPIGHHQLLSIRQTISLVTNLRCHKNDDTEALLPEQETPGPQCIKNPNKVDQFSSVTQLCLTDCDPMDCSTPGFPVHHQLPELAQTHVHRVSDAIQQSHPLLSPSPPAFNLSQHQGLSNESALRIRWPKYWSFSFNISPSSEYSGLISFRIDWFDLLAVQGTLKSLLQHHSSKASILQCSAFFMVQLTSIHDHWKNYSLDRWTFVGKVMSLLFNMLFRFVTDNWIWGPNSISCMIWRKLCAPFQPHLCFLIWTMRDLVHSRKGKWISRVLFQLVNSCLKCHVISGSEILGSFGNNHNWLVMSATRVAVGKMAVYVPMFSTLVYRSSKDPVNSAFYTSKTQWNLALLYLWHKAFLHAQ